MEQQSEWLELSALAGFLKQTCSALPEEKTVVSRVKLHKRLQTLISKFLTGVNLDLDPKVLANAFDDLPAWTTENVLAKLRSLTESNAKKKIRLFCSEISETERQSTQDLLNNAGIHKFRESIELDLYVGIHTAISAYYKMIGVALKQTPEIQGAEHLKSACEPLFRSLKIIASQPLTCLMKLDGLFWDSGLYSIPCAIVADRQKDNISYLVNKAELQRRMLDLSINEQRLGCPALKARTLSDQNSLDVISDLCLSTVVKFSKLI